jgi:hypothetical protein
MEEKKHYYPGIEELHVGFRVELKLHEIKPWEEHIIIPRDNFELQEYINNKLIRVKCLDKEDIESLGFVESGLKKDLFLFKNKIDLTNVGREYTIGLNTNYINHHVIIFAVPYNKTLEFNFNLFVGKLKNKSELKRIMNQLNINK